MMSFVGLDAGRKPGLPSPPEEEEELRYKGGKGDSKHYSERCPELAKTTTHVSVRVYVSERSLRKWLGRFFFFNVLTLRKVDCLPGKCEKRGERSKMNLDHVVL